MMVIVTVVGGSGSGDGVTVVGGDSDCGGW